MTNFPKPGYKARKRQRRSVPVFIPITKPRKGRTYHKTVKELLGVDRYDTLIEIINKINCGPDLVLNEIINNIDRMEIHVYKNSSCAGIARIRVNVIELHAELLKIDMHPEREVDLWTVFYHELAHHIAFQLFKDDGHGRAWKLVMIALNQQPKRCHSIPYISRRRNTKRVAHVYACTDCGTTFNAGRVWKRSKYHIACRKYGTGGTLEYQGKVVVC